MKILCIRLPVILFFIHCSALAQSRNELGLLLGAEIIPDHSTSVPSSSITLSNSSSLQATYARHVTSGKRAALLLELPFVASPSHSVKSTQNTTVSLATLYLAPGFRLSLAPDQSLSPWLSLGGGYGLYETSEKLASGAANPDRFRSTGTLQFGGGIDFKTPLHILFPVGLRAELRDFYTLDTPNFAVPVREQHQHNVVASGGFVIRW